MRAQKSRKAHVEKDVYALYEESLRLLHGGKYDKAKSQLHKLLGLASEHLELVARINGLLKICERRLVEPQAPEQTPGALIDRGVMLHNLGQYDEALKCYERAAQKAAKTGNLQDAVQYAMAATEAAMGNTDKAIQHLRKAIELNAELRFMARSDPDFAKLAENNEFRELARSQEK
jgi:tetratricopeptide (TPR) repeat protein